MSAIRVENLGKRYIIGHQNRNDTLRDALSQGLKGIWRRLRDRGLENEEFWALRDLNFSIEPGEVMGIIGRNGAGKSTLLKILSRITEPTTGSVSLQGRVASLLEVGTGFHPELSGRENIFLNGAILGMTRMEIRRKFDEIVDFAGVEKFLDTPVKRYSSGMYVRLAFAVAAHLEPEILIIDEVLAVGDAEFQKKCLGKMHDVATSGRTVLFVSHNMVALEYLCHSAIMLQAGQKVYQGSIRDALRYYQTSRSADAGKDVSSVKRRGVGAMRMQSIALVDQDNQPIANIAAGMPWILNLTLKNSRVVRSGLIRINVTDRLGTVLTVINSKHAGFSLPDQRGVNRIKCQVPKCPLVPGIYVINVLCYADDEVQDEIDEALEVEVMEKDYYGTGTVPLLKSIYFSDHQWSLEG